MIRAYTYNQVAFENVVLALARIQEYNSSREVKNLEDAQIALNKARKEDDQYLDAVFYSGLAMDLIGKPADASPFFEKIIDEVKDQKIKNEAQYNLGISFYHRYSHKQLERAEGIFIKLLEEIDDIILKNLTRANLAQTYAMWMIPNRAQKQSLLQKGSAKEVLAHIQSKFSLFKGQEKKVRLFLRLGVFRKKIDKNKIRATIDNAKGMALMYYSDFLCKTDVDKLRILEKSLKYLNQSETNISNDWANTCDLASVHWRLAMVSPIEKRKEDEYKIAIQLLTKVITVLRPNYGFALYELGRVYRTKGEFDEAINKFKESLAIDNKYRGICEDTLRDELQLAEKKIAKYP